MNGYVTTLQKLENFWFTLVLLYSLRAFQIFKKITGGFLQSLTDSQSSQLSRILRSIYYFTSCESFIPVLSNGLSLESGFQDSRKYSSQS